MIELNLKEKELLQQIELDALALKQGEPARQNGERANQLMQLLIERKAIPKHRASYFTDPHCNVGGRGKSYKDQFERTGNNGADVFRHPHFLAYLRYFIHGPSFPSAVLSQFKEKIEECGIITSGDILPLAKFARQLARTHNLEPRKASEEFFKLGLEHGMGADTAIFIRNQVRTLKL